MTTCCISSLVAICLFLMWLLWRQWNEASHYKARFHLMSEAYRAATQTYTTQQLHLARERIDELEEERVALYALLRTERVNRDIVEDVHIIKLYPIVMFWN